MKKANFLLLIGSLSFAIIIMEIGSRIILNTNRIKSASMNQFLNQKIFNINPYIISDDE